MTHKDLAAEVEPWLQQCGSCDAGLPMGCTHPEGDYRNVLLKVWRAYETSRRDTAEEIATEITDRPGPDPSPASPAWWAGYEEARADMARTAREIGAKEATR